jgi:hypothetical protein
MLALTTWLGRGRGLDAGELSKIARWCLGIILVAAAVESLWVAGQELSDSPLENRATFMGLATLLALVALLWKAAWGAHLAAALALAITINQVRGFHVYFCLLPFVLWMESHRLNQWSKRWPRLEILANPFFWTLLVFVLQPPLPSPVKPLAISLIAVMGMLLHVYLLLSSLRDSGAESVSKSSSIHGALSEIRAKPLLILCVPMILVSLILVDVFLETRLSPHRLLTMRAESRPRFQIILGSMQACRELQSRWQVFGVMSLSLKMNETGTSQPREGERRDSSCQIEYASEHLRDSIRSKICEILPEIRWREFDRESGLATPGRCQGNSP